MAGLGGGGLPLEHTAWLRPLLTAVACGRADELGARFSSMQRRWERIGRLVHLPMPETEDGLLDELLRQQMEATSTAKGSAPSTLLRCGEMGCAAVAAPPPVVPQPPPARKDDVVFLCAPVGWQHVNMGRALFEENAVFNRVVRECERIAERDQLLPRPLLDVLYPSAEDGLDLEAADALLQTPTFTMPALFAVEYGLVAMCDGCEPYAVVGHSIGEYVAAVVAGVLDLPTAMALVCERGRAMDATPLEGSMISVRADVPTVQAAVASAGVDAQVSIAAINGPQSIVLGGEDTQLARALEAMPRGTKSVRVRTTHPDHTKLMEPIAERVGQRAEALLAEAPAAPARCLWASTVADWPLTDQAAIGKSEYWRRGVVAGVDFPRAVDAVVRNYAASAAEEDEEYGAPPEERRKLRFVEMGEGMLTRFCRDVPCICDLDVYDEIGLDFETDFMHLLPRREKADKAAQARAIESVIELQVKQTTAVRSVSRVPMWLADL